MPIPLNVQCVCVCGGGGAFSQKQKNIGNLECWRVGYLGMAVLGGWGGGGGGGGGGGLFLKINNRADQNRSMQGG